MAGHAVDVVHVNVETVDGCDSQILGRPAIRDMTLVSVYLCVCVCA